ncbi:hypothetical protein MYX84_09215 [Acidobacteria bacterium AH-259-O06]|nr:hypothetical protein [Acidobacteria bacterium AH-259-L09]MDA2930110.1 hypothetical protein [Acidobacteria bacterium AH-259-O06]
MPKKTSDTKSETRELTTAAMTAKEIHPPSIESFYGSANFSNLISRIPG